MALNFMRQSSYPADAPMVLYCIELDPMLHCDHVNYIDGLSRVRFEHEFLVAAYSCFQVTGVVREEPVGASPYFVVRLVAAVDNRSVPSPCVLAPWA